MQCRVIHLNGDVQIVEAKPICGKDFCDGCGDCLRCYWEDDCYRTGKPQRGHRWVVYADLEPERAAQLLTGEPK